MPTTTRMQVNHDDAADNKLQHHIADRGAKVALLRVLTWHNFNFTATHTCDFFSDCHVPSGITYTIVISVVHICIVSSQLK